MDFSRDNLSRYLKPVSNYDELWRNVGFPEVLTVDEYYKLWRRGGLAKRAIKLFPEESWKLRPRIRLFPEDAFQETEKVIETEDANETAWEKELKWFMLRHNLWSQMEQLDIISGIGSYGIMVLVLDDNKDLSEPVDGIDEQGHGEVSYGKNNLLSVRVFQEYELRIDKWDTNPTSIRYGMPSIYTIDFGKIQNEKGQQGTANSTLRVHWHRVIHVADNTDSSPIFGASRLEPIYNDLFSLQKIVSSSGEMYYKGAFPGIALEMDSQAVLAGADLDKEAVKKEMEEYQQGLRRYLALKGIRANSLAPQVVSPQSHFDVFAKLIAATIGCPIRVFLGAEQAQLASQDDIRTWNNRVNKRRENHVTPNIIRPLINRLIQYGIIKEPEASTREEVGAKENEYLYIVSYPSLDDNTEQTKAAIGVQRTQAIAQYASTPGADSIITPEDFLSHILGLPQETVTAIIQNVTTRSDEGITLDITEEEDAPFNNKKVNRPIQDNKREISE